MKRLLSVGAIVVVALGGSASPAQAKWWDWMQEWSGPNSWIALGNTMITFCPPEKNSAVRLFEANSVALLDRATRLQMNRIRASDIERQLRPLTALDTPEVSSALPLAEQARLPPGLETVLRREQQELGEDAAQLADAIDRTKESPPLIICPFLDFHQFMSDEEAFTSRVFTQLVEGGYSWHVKGFHSFQFGGGPGALLAKGKKDLRIRPTLVGRLSVQPLLLAADVSLARNRDVPEWVKKDTKWFRVASAFKFHARWFNVLGSKSLKASDLDDEAVGSEFDFNMADDGWTYNYGFIFDVLEVIRPAAPFRKRVNKAQILSQFSSAQDYLNSR